jgi:hypothetical protein
MPVTGGTEPAIVSHHRAIAAILRSTALPAFPGDRVATNCPVSGLQAPPFNNALLAVARQQGCAWPLVLAAPPSNPIAAHMQADVRSHASALAEQMRELNDLLAPDHRVVWLKGAANLADQRLEPQPWRQMADLDLLVSHDALVAVTDRMERAGYRAGNRPYEERLNPHLPAFSHPDKPAIVEVHSRLLRYREGGLLEPGGVMARAVSRETPNGTFFVPSRADRIVHLIAHAQIGSHRHARRQFVMRDALELVYLAGDDETSVAEAVARFDDVGRGSSCIAFLAVASLIMERNFVAPDRSTAAAERWAKSVFSGWNKPGQRNAWIVLDWISEIGRTLISPEKLSAIARLVTNPALRRDAIAHMGKHLDRD